MHGLRTKVERNANGFLTDNEQLMNGNGMKQVVPLNGQEKGRFFFVHTVFPRIDRARTIYFSALIGARTNRGRGLIEGAV